MTEEQQPEMIDTPSDQVQERTQGQRAAFLFFWILFLVPLLALVVISDMAPGLLLMAVPQIILYVVSTKFYFNLKKPFSAVMWVLVGGILLYYFILLGGCIVALNNMSFH